ncbi:aldehyde dehydrogenase family protein [Collimonas sp. OK412]|jgi:betaine-aldehyde dehydrogenase|uniref:aldehyde dehydrogenase family protein n=1 Tax=Collimonas sp. (strain OK412) TaxID=1801619 RepID=UPI0008E26E73|nr:aldehyde dehydrogenase family protein [Collimonas sp. OK412]SFC67798.1 betaine-aldehyde dehydrogenase [Collimonas sp. OK412]
MLNQPPHQLYIAGRWCNARSGRTETVFNPATETALAEVAFGAAQDIDDAVAAAAAAQAGWGKSPGRARGAFLRAIAGGVQQQQEQLAHLQTANNGKPLSESLIDVGDVIATFNYYAELAEQLDDRQDQPVALPGAGFTATLRHEPCGVAALIVPWNFPMVTTAWKVAPALAAGCTVVLKPSEITPLPELALAAIIGQAGLPAGVFNLVTGDAEAGAALASHPAVRKISFTGSTAVGQAVMKTAADDLKRISLELGGKSAALLFADADLELALDIVCGGIFFNAGQMCSATSRLLVERSIAEDFTARLKQRVESIRVGDPMDPATQMGPLSSRRQYQKVQQYIQQGLAAGLKLITGGTPAQDMDKGYFVAPTIFADVPFDSPLWREEIFGPVLCIHAFDSEQEAIAIANRSEYGLVATVLTADTERASRVSAALEVGLVWVNSPQVIFPQASWGGMKKSSLGRELGPWGLQAFQEIKHVVVAAPG